MARSSSQSVRLQPHRVHGPKMLTSKALPKPSYNCKGKRAAWMNPNFQVKGQDAPTAGHPIKRRKQMGGMHGSRNFHTSGY